MTANSRRENTLAKAAALVKLAREYDRTGNVTMRNQTVRSIEDLPGLSRADIKRLVSEVYAA